MRPSIVLLTTAVFGAAPGLRAQPATGTGGRFTAYSFANARYVVGQSLTVVTGYRLGSLMMVVGGVTKPASGYWAAAIGPGVRIRALSGFRVTSILTVTADRDGAWIDAYAIPSVRLGTARLNASLLWREPLDAGLRRQWKVNPVALTIPLLSHFRVGFGATLAATAGLPGRMAAGPVVVTPVPGGTITTEWLVSRSRGLEARLSYSARR